MRPVPVIFAPPANDGLTGTTPKGGDNEPRPHSVPTTDRGRRLIEIDMSGFIGRTRLCTALCPGQITHDDGSTEYAYRFIELTEAVETAFGERLYRQLPPLWAKSSSA